VGETHCHLCLPPADLAGTLFLNRELTLTRQERERDSVRSYIRPPRPCEPACWPMPRRPHSGVCAPAVAQAHPSGRELACVAAACALHEESSQILITRLLMPSNFCLPPLECSPGTIPIQAASARPFPNALALPIAPIKAVAVTGPTPGIWVSRWQASFSFAVLWMTRSISSMRAASCSSSSLSCAHRTRNEPDRCNSASSRIRGSCSSR
jgi:hypothetical protein